MGVVRINTLSHRHGKEPSVWKSSDLIFRDSYTHKYDTQSYRIAEILN